MMEGFGLGCSSSPRGMASSLHPRLAYGRPCLTLAMATQRTPTGTQKVKVLPLGDKSAVLRQKNNGEASSIKLLSRVEQLRLLSKAEKAGLLSAAENFGFSLSSIEKLGLLSKAEELGILSAATDPNTPGTLLNLAIVLLLAGPLCVYFVPEDSIWQIGLQTVVALLSVVGGPAAFAGSNFVSMLQKSS
ncbi:hypothetical protein SUGI_0952900 [Cryptomeria japonica]|uniref:uncharacterized protein LOC131060952 n=1 Tax=Cryptomeria japonica TaxID=3369 RepID=UPI002414C09C|nr:uncharacterized protein LOC131060952 [Cryptomeria japonica]GLJ45274.1 hypothetical protein SUGI_0952900 [Cryptomeria japonica]